VENGLSSAGPSTFDEEPVVTWEAYNYEDLDALHKEEVPVAR